MSARFQAGSAPDGLGQNFTKPHVARAIANFVADGIPKPSRILEPSAGRGAFMVAAREAWPEASLTGVEFDHGLGNALRASVREKDTLLWGSFFDSLPHDLGSFDLVIGNPPYSVDSGRRNAKGQPIMTSVWESHLEHARRFAPTVVFLLRLSVLGGKERASDFWLQNPISALGIITPRPSFTDDGKTDAAEYAAFVWSDVWHGPGISHISAPRPPKARQKSADR